MNYADKTRPGRKKHTDLFSDEFNGSPRYDSSSYHLSENRVGRFRLKPMACVGIGLEYRDPELTIRRTACNFVDETPEFEGTHHVGKTANANAYVPVLVLISFR